MGGDGPKKVPYLESLSDTAVRMIDPSRDDPRGYSGIPRFRPSAAPTSSIYTFTHVFPPATQQPEFFGKTTLPLDGLLFAYGVTNSGKTYTMQGGSSSLQGSSKYRPARLNGIELNDSSSIFSRAPSLDNFTLPAQQPILGDVLAEHFGLSEVDHDPTTLKKIYDLLTNVEDAGAGTSRTQPILLTRKAFAKEAKRLVKMGQLHRRVFGTLANSQSSRSHGIVTVKLLRKHRGEKDEPSSYMTSRLTLIDLLASGNINKSLMVLGQCIEVMRANQKRVAQSLGASESQRSDTRDVKKSLAVVPFRHSKLTEILMDYFTGEGRVTVIININPYDTGFDENSNVMKFAALTREVSTAAPTQRVPPTGRAKAGGKTGNLQSIGSHHRKVLLSTYGRGDRQSSETQLDVVEEDEDVEDEAEEEPLNGLVEALFDEIERLRLQLFDSEMRSAVVEAETREEVMREMEERIGEIEKRFTRRLMNEVELNEMRMDAKIDMLHRSGVIGKTPGKVGSKSGKSDTRDSDTDELPEITDSSEDDQVDNLTAVRRSQAASPLAGRGKAAKDIRTAVSGHSASHTNLTETVDPTSSPLDALEEEEEFDETEDEGSDIAESESDEPDEWFPASSRPRSTTAALQNGPLPHLQQPPSPVFEKDVKAERTQARRRNKTSVSELATISEGSIWLVKNSPSGSAHWYPTIETGVRGRRR
ncbi:P-loop containing nucleoside triphosphate hydrolase protein [Russula vinacea]|nr:P-loop containing nucleoside triphosphate hydrolase protein [Russula vinacea]